MFRKSDRKTYYSSDNRLEIREIKRFRLKITSATVIACVVCVALLLSVNYLYNNFLGLGNTKFDALMHENRMLRSHLDELTEQMHALKSSMQKLEHQGNQLRLLVDLTTVDEATRQAGFGGAPAATEIDFTHDSTSRLLGRAINLLRELSSEVRLQEASYAQILKKYEHNKEYFAALPALKPMDGYYSPREFGVRMHPVLGIYKTHEGLDIVNDVGTPVYAAGDGIVEMAGHSGGGYGIVVVIRHGFGYQTLYGHLSKALVREGQRVKRGGLIARSGRSGLVSGPHLHYEVRYNGVCQNPIDFFFDDVSPDNFSKQIAAH